jgi:serine phosphatase RsbU (regulator of sigma subunit)
VTAAAGAEVAPARIGRIRAVGAAVLAALALLVVSELRWSGWLRAASFDAHQLVAPRRVASLPVTIVEIDERSLAAVGRWPWPRSLLAQLVDEIGRHGPVAVGIDIFMPEPDPLSPDRLVGRARDGPPEVRAQLAALPTNDATLARSLAATRTVLPIAGMPARTGVPLRVVPFTVRRIGAPPAAGAPMLPPLERFDGAQTSLDALNRAASGWGLISTDPTGGALRRLPLVANVGGTLVPAFAIEILRVALGTPSLRLVVEGTAVEGIEVGRAFVPTEPDGGVRLHFSPRNAERFVSAVDVLEQKLDPHRLREQIVIVGVTGIGLGDYHGTPLGVAMPGSEIQAQLLENIVDGALLTRPAWARGAEAAAVLLLGALLVWTVPAWGVRNAGLLAAACVAGLVAGGFVAFRSLRLVLDAATPGVALLLLFVTLLLLTLAEANRQRRTLERIAQDERERNARMAGELDAARRIQVASLPSADAFRDDARLDLAATMTPAREVGGDLYDFFRLDGRRFFFVVGDVAGKGLPASIFMAVSKALYKSAALRAPDADLGALMADANAEVSRDNPQSLFVTAFAGVLDLDSGELAYCNAGHENPFAVDPSSASVRRLEGGGGPPLCAVDDFPYRAANERLRPGELLCVISDGVTEARNPAGELFGSERVRAALRSMRPGVTSAAGVVGALCAAVDAFAAGADAADDVSLLALRWLGPPPAPAGAQRT